MKGNLTIDSCGSNRTLTLNGVRSVVVEGGDLIIRCNTVYASNDANASWSFIVKDGNILLDPGVSNDPTTGITNIAGVYVSVGNLANASCSLVSTGHFCSLDGGTSQRILKVDGSLYGDAKPLFDSRLYVRGTNAYDILTTGVILSYSNRALVSPPPLLSQYLNNYTVTRVVK